MDFGYFMPHFTTTDPPENGSENLRFRLWNATTKSAWIDITWNWNSGCLRENDRSSKIVSELEAPCRRLFQ